LLKLIGIPASPGVAIGKVHAIDRRRARVPRFHIAPDQVAAELTRLDHAVRDSVEQLRAIRESLGEGEQGDILDAHRMMADDPSALEGVRTLVREELPSSVALFAPALDFAYPLLFISLFSQWVIPHNSRHYQTDFPGPLRDDTRGGRLQFWLS